MTLALTFTSNADPEAYNRSAQCVSGPSIQGGPGGTIEVGTLRSSDGVDSQEFSVGMTAGRSVFQQPKSLKRYMSPCPEPIALGINTNAVNGGTLRYPTDVPNPSAVEKAVERAHF